LSDILAALSALPVSGQERSKVDNAIGYMNNVQNRAIVVRGDLEKNIDDILQAIDSLLVVASVDISEIRLMMDDLLKVWEARWYFYE